MFKIKENNNDYKYATNCLKEAIFNVYSNKNIDVKRTIENEISNVIKNIDTEVNTILRDSFLHYCSKKRENPYLLLSAYESYHKRNLSSKSRIDDYDFTKFTIDSWEKALMKGHRCLECSKIETWEIKKHKYMDKELFQKYKDLEGTYELINALLQSLYEYKI